MNDVVRGGDDLLDGGPGSDRLLGDDGDDQIEANDGRSNRIGCGPCAALDLTDRDAGKPDTVIDAPGAPPADCETVAPPAANCPP